MLKFLFRGLTAQRPRRAPLFDAVTAEARRPHWYLKGQVPDTLDGRFAVLATIMAVILVRLEREGDAGNRVSVALTERFIEVMESEHRELGLGDPTLGKTVRKLVGMLARRTDLWRNANGSRIEAVRKSLYKGKVAGAALKHSASMLLELDEKLNGIPLAVIEQGTIR